MRPNKFLIRSSQPAPPAIETIRASLLDLDASFEFRSTAPMEDLVSRSIGRTGSSRLLLSLWAVFGALALVLAAVGIYGSMSHVVTRRTPEFGVRIALGARPTDMLRLVLKQAVTLTAPGLVLGLAGAWATTRVLANVLFGVTPTDPATFAGVTLFLLAVAIASSLIPAFRASAADPLTATRAKQ
jgi:ABC-type antimicrobial peptide transport system permease subunit